MIGQRAAIVAACLFLAGCEKPPVKTERTDNAEIQVDDLFTHHGCTISRFYDHSRAHYFADCRGAITTTRTESCGKSCVHTWDDEIPTAR